MHAYSSILVVWLPGSVAFSLHGCTLNSPETWQGQLTAEVCSLLKVQGEDPY